MIKSVIKFVALLLMCCMVNGDIVAIPQQKQETWMTVFVHGSYGTAFTLISLLKVFKDETKDSWYSKVQESLRDNMQFYRDRFMMQRGLLPIDLTSSTDDPDVAVSLGIVKAYEQMQKRFKSHEKNSYYTYGWNGLLSQKERRREAVRLYNELAAEVARLYEQGITPKIRLITHSHGGNVALNLAGIHAVLGGEKYSDKDQQAIDLVRDVMAMLQQHDEQNYYKPTAKYFDIDELIMYAPPIQQETERFCFMPFFKKVYHLYSDNDVVQPADFMSTTQRKSKRRIDLSAYNGACNVTQVRVVVGRSSSTQETEDVTDDWLSIHRNIVKNFNETIGNKKINLKASLRGGKVITKHPQDPAHADFWCASWDDRGMFFDPLPIVVFTPIMIPLLEEHNEHRDIVMNLTKQDRDAFFMLFKTEHDGFISATTLPLKEVGKMQKTLKDARPKKVSYSFSLSGKKKK